MAKHRPIRELCKCDECGERIMHSTVCEDCGSYEKWERGENQSGKKGLFCTVCGSGFTWVKCPHCDYTQPSKTVWLINMTGKSARELNAAKNKGQNQSNGCGAGCGVLFAFGLILAVIFMLIEGCSGVSLSNDGPAMNRIRELNQ